MSEIANRIVNSGTAGPLPPWRDYLGADCPEGLADELLALLDGDHGEDAARWLPDWGNTHVRRALVQLKDWRVVERMVEIANDDPGTIVDLEFALAYLGFDNPEPVIRFAKDYIHTDQNLAEAAIRALRILLGWKSPREADIVGYLCWQLENYPMQAPPLNGALLLAMEYASDVPCQRLVDIVKAAPRVHLASAPHRFPENHGKVFGV
jgi:hypothetical protein